MEILLNRKENLQEETIGNFRVCDIEVYSLEDQHQTKKVYSETRIPEGRYEIKFRKVGGHHARYLKKFPKIHKGMLELQNVPNFKYILIHIGNTDDDTAGCILVGLGKSYSVKDNIKRAKLTSSTKAYLKIYPIIANELEKDERVFITVVNPK